LCPSSEPSYVWTSQDALSDVDVMEEVRVQSVSDQARALLWFADDGALRGRPDSERLEELDGPGRRRRR
jgi:hypothetical protein